MRRRRGVAEGAAAVSAGPSTFCEEEITGESFNRSDYIINPPLICLRFLFFGFFYRYFDGICSRFPFILSAQHCTSDIEFGFCSCLFILFYLVLSSSSLP